MDTQTPLLEIRGATKFYEIGKQAQRPALNKFDLTIYDQPATITAIAGESGSGKTTLANAALGFHDLSTGQILYRGRDIAKLSRLEQRTYRREVQAVFQDPYDVYNPFYRVQHVFDVLIKNFRLAPTRVEAKKLVEEACQAVGLNADDVLDKYPHQLSGGQRQRLMIARAYLLKPRLIVADEPVSMIDASLRATILDIMLWMRDRHQISFLYITHDLSTAYQIADQIYVMYRGETVEQGSAQTVISAPKHPYVQLLVDSVPVPDPQVPWATNTVLKENDTHNVQGCPFYGRCPHRMPVCLSTMPPMIEMGTEQKAACYLYDSSVAKAAIQG